MKLGCGSKIHRNKKRVWFLYLALSLVHFIIICEKRTGWPEAEAVHHCRKAFVLSEPVILPVSLFFDARGIWLYVRKTNYWKVFFSLFNLPLYWGYSVQLIHIDIKLILSGITERHCGYYMLCCVLYLFKLFTFQIT